MGRPKSTTPTDAEMRILSVFWKHSGRSLKVRDVKAELPNLGHSSIATIVHIMVRKGFVTLADARRPQTFRAQIGQTETLRSVADRVIRDNFGGNPVLAIQAIYNAFPTLATKRTAKAS